MKKVENSKKRGWSNYSSHSSGVMPKENVSKNNHSSHSSGVTPKENVLHCQLQPLQWRKEDFYESLWQKMRKTTPGLHPLLYYNTILYTHITYIGGLYRRGVVYPGVTFPPEGALI